MGGGWGHVSASVVWIWWNWRAVAAEGGGGSLPAQLGNLWALLSVAGGTFEAKPVNDPENECRNFQLGKNVYE